MLKRLGQVLAALILLAVIAAGLTVAAPHRQGASHELTTSKTPVLWVLSDSHFITPQLHDQGEAFTEIKQSAAGKDIQHQPVAIKALVHAALTAKPRPTAVILTGDVTFNGERASAQDLAKRLAALQAAGIHVLAIPGNHDIYDGWARKYKGKNQYKVPQISPTEWRRIFSDGYQSEIDEDSASLSYTIALNANYQLIMLDSNIYTIQPSNRNPNTGGELKPATMSWLKTQLAAGKKAGRTSLVFMHHNLYQHNHVVSTGYVLNNAKALRKLLTRYQVPVLFSGHIHAQDVMAGGDGEPVEVVNGSYSISPAGYGVVQLTSKGLTYTRKQADLSPVLTAKQKQNPELAHYQRYLKKLFLQNGEGLAVQSLYNRPGITEADLDAGMHFIGELNWRFFTGQDHISDAEVKALKQTRGYQVDAKTASLKRYINTIIQDTNMNDLHFTIKTK